MSDYLSLDIIAKIFHNAFAKDLGICACVSKDWNSMIKNSDVLSKNLNHSFSSPSQLCLVRIILSNGKEQYSLHLDNYHFTFFKHVFCPPKRDPGFFKIIGSCNGMICLADDVIAEDETYIFWNPLIRRFESFSSPLITGRLDPLVGFGYDSQRSDFKLLKIIEPNVEVFSLKSFIWKNVNVVIPCDEILWQEGSTFLYGCVHFVGLRSGRNEILRFHIEEESFSTSIEFPEHLATNMEDTMSTFAYRNSSIGVFFLQSVGWHIWIMENYAVVDSWAPLIVIDGRQGTKPVGFRNNGDVMLQNSDGQIQVLELESRERRNLIISGMFPFAFVGNYVESLALRHRTSKKRGREN